MNVTTPRLPGDGVSVWDVTNPEAPFARLEADARADLAVVGGGILGLTTALAAAEAGLAVVVVERGRLAAGASGRTSGFVAPALRPLPGGQTLEQALGEERAQRLRTLAAGSGKAVFDMIDRHGLDVPTARAGWMAAAHTGEAFARLAAEAGPEDRVLDAAAVRVATGIDRWHGGVVHAHSGAIDPKSYVRELARAAATAGAVVFEETLAEVIRPAPGGRVELVCGGASIEAGHVVVATNAAARLVPEVAAGVLPVTVYQVVTKELPGEMRDAVLPAGYAVTDTRRNSIALRWTPDGRLLTGGFVRPALRPAAAEARATYGARLAEVVGPAARRAGLPLSSLEPDMIWHGRIAITGTGLPFLHAPHPGVTAVVACNGRGIALGTAVGTLLGRTIAESVGGPIDLDRIPVPLRAPPPRPLRYVSGFGARIRSVVADVLDRRDLANAAPPDIEGDPK